MMRLDEELFLIYFSPQVMQNKSLRFIIIYSFEYFSTFLAFRDRTSEKKTVSAFYSLVRSSPIYYHFFQILCVWKLLLLCISLLADDIKGFTADKTPRPSHIWYATHFSSYFCLIISCDIFSQKYFYATDDSYFYDFID